MKYNITPGIALVCALLFSACADPVPVEVFPPEPEPEPPVEERGEFSYTIRYPVDAAAEISLQKWPDLDDIALSPANVGEGSGISETLELEAGSYLLTVMVSKSGLFTGIGETIEIEPALATEYSRQYADDDFVLTLPGAIVASTAQWSAALVAVRNGGSGTVNNPKTYAIMVCGAVPVPGSAAAATSFGSAQDIEVTLAGRGTLALSSSGSILRLGGNQTLIVDDENLTLRGRSNNNNAALYVQSGGVLELIDGVISGNTSSSNGGGVAVYGSFTMHGGEISGNSAGGSYSYGGGLAVYGSFIMHGGKISGNNARYGGGVYVGGSGAFTMSGGAVYGSDADQLANSAGSNGAALYVVSGTAQYGDDTNILPQGSLYTNDTIIGIPKNYTENPDATVKPLILSSNLSPLNMVFLGDGFIMMDNIDGGLFDDTVAELYDYIFSIQPFAEYRDYFSVYKVYADSNSRGAKTSPAYSAPDTAFDSTFNYGGIERLLVARNTAKAREYARLATDAPHLIVMIVNDARFGGSGGEIAVTSINPSARQIVIHELGHIFDLVDEYVDEEYRQAVGLTLAQAVTKPNVDVTNDLTEIKWKHFVGLSGYNDSAWEGAYYFATGVWRSTEHSIMRDYDIIEFNAISRETIVKKIIQNAGETYSFENFLSRDFPPSGLRRFAAKPSYKMPVPLDVYVWSLYGDQQIRARFAGANE